LQIIIHNYDTLTCAI